jgi:hypothetical protein
MPSQIPVRYERISKLLLTIITATTLLFLGCAKDKTTEPELPLAGVETSGLSFMSPIVVELTGKVINEGPQKIIDHGFIYWFGSEKELSQGIKVSLGADIESGFFTTMLTGLQFKVVNGVPELLVAKAYVTDKTGTRYGQVFSNNYRGTLATDVSPIGGKTGDIITINGNYNGLKPNDIKVTFANIQAQVKTLTNKVITVEVPNGIPVGHGQRVRVKVQVGAVSLDVNTEFPIWANIKDINPKSGPIGTKIVFTGDNLPLTKDGMIIGFGEEAWGVNYFDASYYVRVPSSVQTEKVKLYCYRSERERITLPFEFTVTPPVIKSISPNPAISQQVITIHMDNMEPYYAGNEPRVTIAHASDYVQPNENGDLVFRPKIELKSGESYHITIEFGPHKIQTTTPLTIAKVVATGFSPDKGYPGTAVHITGRFAKGANTFVGFGEDGYSFADAISDTELVVYVPLGIENKKYSLYIKDETGDIKIPGIFEAQSIRFDAVSPVSGPPGSILTITGQGFYNRSGNEFTANFGGPVLHSTQVNLTKIMLEVPTFTVPGTYPIILQHDNVTFDTGLTYTVTK